MKRLFILILTLSIVLGLCGCQAASRGPVYGMILTHKDQAFQQKILEGFQIAAQELNADVVVKYADTVDGQIQAIEALQEQGVEAIAIRPADTTGLHDALRNAANEGIVITTVDSNTDGAQYFVNQADSMSVAQALMDAIYDMTGGAGEFAVISDASLAVSMIPWISEMEIICRDEKYKDLTWVETVRCTDKENIETETLALTEKYPELEVICCTSSSLLQGCCQTLEAKASTVKATGLSNPAAMKDLVGSDKVCPYFFLWNPVDIGWCCGYTIDAALNGLIGEAGSTFTAKNENTYKVNEGFFGEKMIYVGPPYQFTPDNFALWAEVY